MKSEWECERFVLFSTRVIRKVRGIDRMDEDDVASPHRSNLWLSNCSFVHVLSTAYTLQASGNQVVQQNLQVLSTSKQWTLCFCPARRRLIQFACSTLFTKESNLLVVFYLASLCSSLTSLLLFAHKSIHIWAIAIPYELSWCEFVYVRLWSTWFSNRRLRLTTYIHARSFTYNI